MGVSRTVAANLGSFQASGAGCPKFRFLNLGLRLWWVGGLLGAAPFVFKGAGYVLLGAPFAIFASGDFDSRQGMASAAVEFVRGLTDAAFRPSAPVYGVRRLDAAFPRLNAKLWAFAFSASRFGSGGASMTAAGTAPGNASGIQKTYMTLAGESQKPLRVIRLLKRMFIEFQIGNGKFFGCLGLAAARAGEVRDFREKSRPAALAPDAAAPGRDGKPLGRRRHPPRTVLGQCMTKYEYPLPWL